MLEEIKLFFIVALGIYIYGRVGTALIQCTQRVHFTEGAQRWSTPNPFFRR